MNTTNTQNILIGENNNSNNIQSKERKVISLTFDFSVQDLVNKLKDGDIIIPKLQRNYVWSIGGNETKPSRLIESLILNMPIPNFYFAEDETLRYSVIDGQQRINTFKRFLNDEFELENLDYRIDLNGKKYSDLPILDRDKIRKRGIRAIVIANDSDQEVRFDIFERLNTGSMELSSQDIRHAIYDGNFNKLLSELAKIVYQKFTFSARIDRETKAGEELVLRFFSFYTQGETSFGTEKDTLKVFLNQFMKKNKDVQLETMENWEKAFKEAMYDVTSWCGDKPFQNSKNLTEWEGKSNRGVFDMLMLAFAWEKDIKITKKEFKLRYESALRSGDIFAKFGYTDKSYIMKNVNIIRGILRGEQII